MPQWTVPVAWLVGSQTGTLLGSGEIDLGGYPEESLTPFELLTNLVLKGASIIPTVDVVGLGITKGSNDDVEVDEAWPDNTGFDKEVWCDTTSGVVICIEADGELDDFFCSCICTSRHFL